MWRKCVLLLTLDLTMKQIAVFLFLLLVCVEAFCQSERSNELYAKGVELYQAGKYKEAIPLFEVSGREVQGGYTAV